MELRAHSMDGLDVITVEEARIDAASAIQFKDRMRELTAGMAGRVILDLQNVTFIDSSGLGAIVAAMKQTTGDQVLELAGLSAPVDKVFRMTRMDSIFAIHTDVAAARTAAFG